MKITVSCLLAAVIFTQVSGYEDYDESIQNAKDLIHGTKMEIMNEVKKIDCRKSALEKLDAAEKQGFHDFNECASKAREYVGTSYQNSRRKHKPAIIYAAKDKEKECCWKVEEIFIKNVTDLKRNFENCTDPDYFYYDTMEFENSSRSDGFDY